MRRQQIRCFALAVLVSSTPLAFAYGGAADGDDAAANQSPTASTEASGQLPAGAATLPPSSPPANLQPSGIGNISDVRGSMSDGAPAAASREAPASAEQAPPILPRGTQQDGGVNGNRKLIHRWRSLEIEN
jgi:hypothetical protein